MISLEEEKIILQLKKTYDNLRVRLKDLNLDTYLSNSSQIKLDRDNHANGDTLSAHATNGVVLLLAILTGKQLLPSNQRNKMGIPTLTGESKYFKRKMPDEIYHTEWQNFVSTVDFQCSAPNIDLLDKYMFAAKGEFSSDAGIFIKKLQKIYKKFNVDELGIFFEKTNEKVIYKLYEQLASIGIIIIGDGIGHAKLIHSMGSENKYERVNIRAVIIPHNKIDYFHNLFYLIKVDDIALITRRDFQIFYRQKQASNIEAYKVINYEDSDSINKNPIAHFSKDFIDTFGSKIPCNFYFNSEEVTLEKEMEYKNKDKSLIKKIIPVTYSKEEIIAFSDSDETLKNKLTLTSFNYKNKDTFHFKSFSEKKEKTASDYSQLRPTK